jgi:RNA polymerase sigma-70 factor (ECF subfamily)
VHLVGRAQRGSRRAFDVLWVRYAPTVQSILLTMVADEEAEDLTQEVAVAAFRSLASLKNQASFPAWLCAIARNAGRDALSAHRRVPEPLALEEIQVDELRAPEQGDPTAPDEIMAQIRALPDCYRESLTLRLLLGLSGPEIAEQTGMTEGSVRVNLCRGMKLLRQRLRHWGAAG